MLEEFRHGVFFVDLSPIENADLLVPSIAGVLDVREGPRGTLEDALKEHLSSREMVLILDNFEQIMHGAPLVADLISVAPDVVFLVTSREPPRSPLRPPIPASPYLCRL